MAKPLFDRNGHQCILYTDLSEDEGGAAVQANQCLIVDAGQAMLLDPGGTMTYNELYMELTKVTSPKKLRYIFASHADPDIIASLPRWLTGSETRLLISRIWSRFVPHFCPSGKTDGRIVPIPDKGGVIALGNCRLTLLPAHFLHAEGNLQVYDPVSRILFSGDLGASLLPAARAADIVEDLGPHLQYMTDFHRRYMTSNRACRLWASMARKLQIDMLVPQHGAPMVGKAVDQFIAWISDLNCGIDLMTEVDYQVPPADKVLGAAT